MKKTLLLIVAVLGFTVAQAQGVRPGFRIGANYSSMVGRDVPADVLKYRFGYHGGIILNFEIADIFSIQPEILYSAKGYQYGDAVHAVPGPGGTTIPIARQGYVKYNYIDIPVLFRSKAGALYFELGPQISYLVNSKRDVTPVPNPDMAPDKGDLTALDYGIAAGIGLDVIGIQLGLRYNAGLNPLEKGIKRLNVSDLKHSVFQLSVGYMVPTGN